MKLKMFTVYDSKAEAYMQPFFQMSTGQAVRAFENSCNDERTEFFRHAADFTLFEIGEYDDQIGKTLCYEAAINLGTALQIKTQTKKTEPQQ